MVLASTPYDMYINPHERKAELAIKAAGGEPVDCYAMLGNRPCTGIMIDGDSSEVGIKLKDDTEFHVLKLYKEGGLYIMNIREISQNSTKVWIFG